MADNPMTTCPLDRDHLKVVKLLADGAPAKAVAGEIDLGMSHTYRMIREIAARLNVHTNAGIVAIALRNGWIE